MTECQCTSSIRHSSFGNSSLFHLTRMQLQEQNFMSLNYRELKRRYDLDGAAQTSRHLCEALANRELVAEDFSLRDLAEALVPDGREWVRLLDPRSTSGASVMESVDGVD